MENWTAEPKKAPVVAEDSMSDWDKLSVRSKSSTADDNVEDLPDLGGQEVTETETEKNDSLPVLLNSTVARNAEEYHQSREEEWDDFIGNPGQEEGYYDEDQEPEYYGEEEEEEEEQDAVFVEDEEAQTAYMLDELRKDANYFEMESDCNRWKWQQELKKNEELSGENATLKENVQELTAENATLIENVDELTAENATLNENVERLTAENYTLNENIEELDDELDSLEHHVKGLTRENASLRDNFVALEAGVDSRDEDAKALVAKNASLTETVKKHQEEAMVSKAEKTQLKRSVEEVRRENASLRKELEELKRQNAHRREIIAQLQKGNISVEEGMKELKRRLKGESDKLAVFESEARELKTLTETQADKIDNLESKLEKLSDDLIDQIERFVNSDKEVRNLTQQLMKRTEELNISTARSHELKSMFDTEYQRVAMANHQLQHYWTDLTSKSQRLFEVGQLNDSLKQEMEVLAGALGLRVRTPPSQGNWVSGHVSLAIHGKYFAFIGPMSMSLYLPVESNATMNNIPLNQHPTQWGANDGKPTSRHITCEIGWDDVVVFYSVTSFLDASGNALLDTMTEICNPKKVDCSALKTELKKCSSVYPITHISLGERQGIMGISHATNTEPWICTDIVVPEAHDTTITSNSNNNNNNDDDDDDDKDDEARFLPTDLKRIWIGKYGVWFAEHHDGHYSWHPALDQEEYYHGLTTSVKMNLASGTTIKALALDKTDGQAWVLVYSNGAVSYSKYVKFDIFEFEEFASKNFGSRFGHVERPFLYEDEDDSSDSDSDSDSDDKDEGGHSDEDADEESDEESDGEEDDEEDEGDEKGEDDKQDGDLDSAMCWAEMIHDQPWYPFPRGLF